MLPLSLKKTLFHSVPSDPLHQKKIKIFYSDIQYLQIHRTEKETILNIQLALLIDGLVFLKRISPRWASWSIIHQSCTNLTTIFSAEDISSCQSSLLLIICLPPFTETVKLAHAILYASCNRVVRCPSINTTPIAIRSTNSWIRI